MFKKNLPIMMAIGCFILFLVMTFLVMTGYVSYLDNFIYDLIIYPNEGLTFILKIFTEFGDAIILVLITALFLFLFKQRVVSFLIAINLVIVTIIGQIAKYIFTRPRPVDNVLIDVDGYSFPSGHSIVSIAFYGLLIYLCAKKIKNKFLRIITICSLSLLILVIGYSRIYLGAHFPSDVIGGFALGGCCLLIFITFVVKKRW